MKTKTNMYLGLGIGLFLLLGALAFLVVSESIISSSKLIEGDNLGDVIGLIYCVNGHTSVNDINDADTRIIKNDCRWGGSDEFNRMVISTTTWTLKGVYPHQDPLPNLKQFDYISTNAKKARSGKQITYDGKDAYCVENENIYGIHTLETINAGTWGWVDTNLILKNNVCCNPGRTDGDNKCVDYEWVYQAPSCDSHDEKKCSGGDVYWYDSCGDREDKKESCDYDCENGKCIEEEEEPPITCSAYFECLDGTSGSGCSYEEVCGEDENPIEEEITEDKTIVYRLSDNKCNKIEVVGVGLSQFDYQTLEECENHVVKKTDKIFYIIGGIILIFIILLILVLVLKKKK